MHLNHIRILEGKSLLWDDICVAYKKKISSEDYKVMYNIDYKKLDTLVNTKPFFSEQYVVELHLTKINNKTLNSLVKYMKCEWLCFILICTVKDDYDLLEAICKQGFNGYKITYKYWHGYVLARLKKEPKCNLENIYKALTGRYEMTDVVIDVIKKYNGDCTLKQINTIIGKKDRVSLDIVWFNILLRNEKGRKDVFKFLEEYRYGYNFIHTSLKNKYNEMLKFYADFNKGKLNERNMRDYRKDTHLSSWIINNYIEIFSKLSFDEILIIGEMIETTNVNSTASMFALVGRLYSRLV